MCTTFLCYNIVKYLLKTFEGRIKLLDYPNLIRLNPNIPWKTRGNAALVLRVRTDIPEEELFEISKSFVRKFATSPRANAGLVLLRGQAVPEVVLDFSRRALFSVLSRTEAEDIIFQFNLRSFGLRSEQGLVGALAGIGNLLTGDHTYELIVYRRDLGRPRVIEKSKLIKMCEATFPGTFSSFDHSTGRVMIAPHGPDPVLCGIRGEAPVEVLRAFSMLSPVENFEGYMIFRSNQGTGEHLSETIELDDVKAYTSGKIVGEVSAAPEADRGGHVFFRIKNEKGDIPCACYEPTGEFRKSAMSLVPGDLIEIAGGIRKSTSVHPKILNVEYFVPLRLAGKSKLKNPECPDCGTSMSSKGKNQGYACRKCGRADKTTGKTMAVEEPRKIELGQLYLPPLRAHRHLTKPLQRYSQTGEKSLPLSLIENWLA